MKFDDYLVKYGNKAFTTICNKAKEHLDGDEILVNSDDVKEITQKSWSLIERINQLGIQVFQFGNSLAVLEKDRKRKIYSIKILDDYLLRHHLIRWANWVTYTRRDRRPYVHSKTVLEDILVRPKSTLPYLEGVVYAPTFAADGTLITEPGYCFKTELFYSPPKYFVLPDVPLKPSASEVDMAKKLILTEAFGDFPFVGNAEQSHAVALLCLPFARNMIDGATPLHLIDKSTAGTGASLLVRVISYICTGRDFTVLPEGKDGEEWRKRLTAVLRNAPILLNIDNLNRTLDSSALAIALTNTIWEDRILGLSKHAHIPIRCAWVATGNNPSLSYEIARRTIRIRMDAKMECPHLRNPEDFRHPDIILWTQENRAQLVWAVLVLIQNWISQGKPRGTKSLGGFEVWASVLGGILEAAGIEGFLENKKELYEDVQTEVEQKRILIGVWYKKYGEKTIKAADLFKIPQAHHYLPDSIDSVADRSAATKLGIFIKKLKDQVFELSSDDEDVTVVVRTGGKIENTTGWRLQVLNKNVKKPRIKVKRKKGPKGP